MSKEKIELNRKDIERFTISKNEFMDMINRLTNRIKKIKIINSINKK